MGVLAVTVQSKDTKGSELCNTHLCRQRTLVSPELLCIALLRVRLAVLYAEDVHRTVANIAEHICTVKRTQLICHCREALRKYLRVGNPNMVFRTTEREINDFVRQEIGFELFFLLPDPSQREPRRQEHLRRGHTAEL